MADFVHDLVTAIDEAKAAGETAALFTEIRQTNAHPAVHLYLTCGGGHG
jgi:hypothetical protein